MNREAKHEEIDPVKLVAAVRGSRAARVLFEYRSHVLARSLPDNEAIKARASSDPNVFADAPVADFQAAQVRTH